MKRTRFSETQIITALKSHEQGRSADDLSRELGITRVTFYNWKRKYGGMEVNELKRLKELEEENRKLKHMYADLALDHRILKEVMEKNFPGSVKKERLPS
jgi:putative transposase